MKRGENARAKIANKAFQKICRSDLGVPRIGKDVYPETTKLARAFFSLVAHDIDADLKLTGHRTISSAHIRKFAARRGIELLRPSAELCKQHSSYNKKFRTKRKQST
jgi:hypothetical protein